MTLSCPTGRPITIQSGYYGKYTYSCDYTGCPPNPNDCKESIEGNTPNDWEALISSCNNKTTCQWIVSSHNLTSCDGSSSYGLVYYSCLPGNHCFLPTTLYHFDSAFHTTTKIVDSEVGGNKNTSQKIWAILARHKATLKIENSNIQR